ncbi:MAG: holo-ACP synthase [Acidobacteria bacterium]|jgi:holo-[acyl-carrier protein] synthase|nr:holo-ACP synthase [Acidobacteriota bacterium]
MIKGTGIDIIDIPRIKKMITDDNNFIEKLFTETETRYCESKFRKEIHYAARFAAKEAFFKALGTGWRNGMRWTDISIENDELGKPGITLYGKTLAFFKEKNYETIHLSISHTKEYAVAFVVIE